jgi:hypothetical protein
MPTETQTAPVAAPAPETVKIVQPQVDVQLSSLFEQRANQDRNTFKEILKYIRDHKIDRKVVLFTLSASKDKGGRGLSEGSAKTETSRIFNLLKDDNKQVLEDLLNDKITVQESRELAQGSGKGGRKPGSTNGQHTPVDPMLHSLQIAINIAVNGESPLSKEDFLKTVSSMFDNAIATKAAIDAAKASGAVQTQGSVSATPASAPASAPVQQVAAQSASKAKKA